MTVVITDQGQLASWTDRDPAEQAPVEIQVGPARPEDEAAVCAMVAHCSRMSLYHRFHGSTDGLAYTRALFATGSIDRILLAWNQGVCMGMAGLASDGEGIGHLGVLVEDAWQRRGVGTRLVAALLTDARARGESSVRADVLGEDEFIVHALRRAGPLKLFVTRGTYSIEVDLVAAGE